MWNLTIIDTDKPLYIAIADALERDMQEGILQPGDRLPTHRALARTVGVTVTTVTRAYREAENRGLVTAMVGSGTFVTAGVENGALAAKTGAYQDGLIEMGLVLPLHVMEEDIRGVMERMMRKNDLRAFMQYTPPEGMPAHREAGAEWIRRFGVKASADTVVVTSGAQHAIDNILPAVFEPGDCIAVEALTYPGVKSAARRYGIQLVGVEMDGEGMLPRALRAICDKTRIRGVYLMGGVQNPTNAKMSGKRRQEIAACIEEQGLVLVEDDQYGFLCAPPAQALSALLPNHSIYIAGISKAFYAGLRVGFLHAPRQYCNRIAQAIVDCNWMTSPLCAAVACETIKSGMADRMIEKKRLEIDRRAALFKEVMAGQDYTYADHSMFAWMRLPAWWDSLAFERAAKNNGVHVVSAASFAAGSAQTPSCIRVSLTGAPTPPVFGRGLTSLLAVMNREAGGVVSIV